MNHATSQSSLSFLRGHCERPANVLPLISLPCQQISRQVDHFQDI
jgi:hypothetical protein